MPKEKKAKKVIADGIILMPRGIATSSYVPYILGKVAAMTPDMAPMFNLALMNHVVKENEDLIVATIRIWENEDGWFDSVISMSSFGAQFSYRQHNLPMWNICGNNMNGVRKSIQGKENMLGDCEYKHLQTYTEFNELLELAFSKKIDNLSKVKDSSEEDDISRFIARDA